MNYIIHYDESVALSHAGNKNSGRYPRGSGERPHQHDGLLTMMKNEHRYQKSRYKLTKNQYKNAKANKKAAKENLKNSKHVYNISKDNPNKNNTKLHKMKFKEAKFKYKSAKMTAKNMKTVYKKVKTEYKKTYSSGKAVLAGLLTGPVGLGAYKAAKIEGYKERHPKEYAQYLIDFKNDSVGGRIKRAFDS